MHAKPYCCNFKTWKQHEATKRTIANPNCAFSYSTHITFSTHQLCATVLRTGIAKAACGAFSRIPHPAGTIHRRQAVIGLAALSALDLVVTCGQRTVVSARP